MSTLRIVIRHCSRCSAKTELCVTVISLEALVSFDSKVFTHASSFQFGSVGTLSVCESSPVLVPRKQTENRGRERLEEQTRMAKLSIDLRYPLLRNNPVY